MPRTREATGRERLPCARPAQQDFPGLSFRKKRARNININEPSQRRSLLHGQDMGKTQDHRNIIEQWLAVGGGWRSLWAVLNKKKRVLSAMSTGHRRPVEASR